MFLIREIMALYHHWLIFTCLFGMAMSDNNGTADLDLSSVLLTSDAAIETDLHPNPVAQSVAWGEWSSWSKWSPCTRSCGGGISHQQRRCRRKPCKSGKSWNVKYKICNPAACEEPSDFRAEQCAAFDSVPYGGQLLKWYPHHDPTRPCSLICRGVETTEQRQQRRRRRRRDLPTDPFRSTGDALDTVQTREDDREGSNELEGQHIDTDDAIVVRLADRVEDGTKCHPRTSSVCIAGTCTRVGCDMRVGSNKNHDACGVCGGNGSSCQPRYSWSLESISVCSVACGGGFRMAKPVCTRADRSLADNSSCDPGTKPSDSLLPCNTHPCTTKWIPGEWSRCSASCGAGSRTRAIFCTEENGNETTKLPDHRCNAIHKPRHQDICNIEACPTWESGPWSQCSRTCGNGVRRRSIACRDSEGRFSSHCEASERPEDQEECQPSVACAAGGDTHASETTQPLTQPLMQSYREPPPAPLPEKLMHQKIPSESTFVTEEWSACSVTCGEGIRRREVHCKIFLELSRTIANLPDDECPGPKPADREKCVEARCNSENPLDENLSYRIVETVGDGVYEESNLMDSYGSSSSSSSSFAGSAPSGSAGGPSGPSGYESNVKVAPGSSIRTTYSWKEAGYTPCTATCLGGVQDLIINCVRDDDGKVVMPLLCTKETKPESRIRTCNDHPCPPRWNYSDFSACMSPCGIGIQTRDVICIHEVARGPGNTVVVPNQMCKPPPPADRQHCNVLDCPVKWQPGEWSRCSKSCGGGVKRRKVACEQVMAQGHKQYRSDRDCPGNKPPTEKPCNTRSCDDVSSAVQPTILSVNASFFQRNIEQKVDLKIGGTATVLPGTGVVKIRCPVKKFKKNQIEWTKNGEELHKSRKYKISRKGALRIMDITHSDDGIYACIAGQSQADIRVIVNTRPREQMSSEEILRTGNTVRHRQETKIVSDRGNSGEHPQIDRVAPGYQSSFTFGNQDLSHEARLEVSSSGKPTKRPPRNRKKPRPSSLPPDSSIHHGEYTVVTSLNQPGYQESVESTAASSGASELKPHLSKLFSSFKAYWPYWPFQPGEASAVRYDGATAGPSRTSKPAYLENESGDDTSRNLLGYGSISDAEAAAASTIPDDTFGPDEERIFIDDASYDFDASSLFGIYDERAAATLRLAEPSSPSLRSERSERGRASPEEASPLENYTRNQRGTDPEHQNHRRNASERRSRGWKNSEITVRESGRGLVGFSNADAAGGTTSDDRPSNAPESTEPMIPPDLEDSIRQDNCTRACANVGDDDLGATDSSRVGTVFASATASKSSDASDETVAAELNNTSSSWHSAEETGERVTLEWVTTDWSECSQTCGAGGGFQMRGAECTVRGTSSQGSDSGVGAGSPVPRTIIGAPLCEEAGLPVPEKIRPCGSGACPQWHTGEWSPCESSRCFNWKTAMQRRDTSCRLTLEAGNVTSLDSNECDDAARPPQRQECYNDACKGVWRVGEWSECTASCEENGMKYRILQCVWFGTKKPAGNACRDVPRPPVMKTCTGQPCRRSVDDCREDSRLCARVKLMNMCRLPLYQQQCCESCR